MQRTLIAALAATLLLSATGWAQFDEDPIFKEIKRALKALSPSRLQSQPDFQRSRSSWRAEEQQIHSAVEEQNRALGGPPAGLEAVRARYHALAQNSSRAVDHYLYGRLMGLDGQLEVAFSHFKRALTLDRYFFWAWDGVGVYYLNKGDNRLAKDAFERALQINKQHLKSEFGLVDLAVRARDFNTAVSHLLSILMKAGQDEAVRQRARFNLAQVYRQRGEFAEAIGQIDQLLRPNERQLNLRLMRAHCHRALERWTEAAKDYRKIIQLDPTEYRYYFSLAGCYARLGRNADAVVEYDQGLRKAGSGLDFRARNSTANERDRLAKLPRVEDPSKRELSFDKLIARVGQAPEVERRRDAIFVLSGVPWPLPDRDRARRLLLAFSKAVEDPDDIVAAKGLQQVAARLPGNENVFGLLEVVALDTRMGSKVRGMACHLLSAYHRGKPAIPILLMALRNEADPYVFSRIHESLNRLTLAWIERVPPETLQLQDMSRIRGKWQAWYKKHRDMYRKHEPKEF
ncbi:MAG: tetratricopeptide repeat protein [Planctomycetota bacterium]